MNWFLITYICLDGILAVWSLNVRQEWKEEKICTFEDERITWNSAGFFFFIVFQLEFHYSWEDYMDSAFSWITRCIQNEPRLCWLWYIWCLWFLVDLARNVKQHRLKIKFMGHPCSVTFSGYFIWIHAFWWPLITQSLSSIFLYLLVILFL